MNAFETNDQKVGLITMTVRGWKGERGREGGEGNSHATEMASRPQVTFSRKGAPGDVG